jgi:uncharacterized glyoxalase superfamily protein PhnB
VLKLAIPLLHVSSSKAAEKFFCDGLGFKQLSVNRPDARREDPCYMDVARDGVVIHVSSFSGDGVAGGVVNIFVDDVDALHAELEARGVRIDMEPTDQTWGHREMYVKDDDRNCIRFMCEIA